MLVMNPYIPNDEKTRDLFYHDKCDKYDYLIAVTCGAISGMIDIFLVGAPGDSVLGNWSDKQVDNVVMSFARKTGWNPSDKNAHNVKSAIGYLEHGKNNGKAGDFQGFRVNYDQRHSADIDDLFTMSPRSHHFQSLAHSPDIIGLFFSILNQFTSTASFVSGGKLITVTTETFELHGGNLPAKLFCGFTNWLGHVMSDIAGASGSKGRGSGLAVPFYELFQFCNFGSFSTGDGKKTLAELATNCFEEGYDARFGLAMAIPVLLCELSIRLVWALKRHFYLKKPLKECIPTSFHDDLRMMLLFGHGTLCIMDGADAAIRSGGNWLTFFTRLNIVAWFRFVTLVLKEVCIRVGFTSPMQKQLEAYRKINASLTLYLQKLKQIDIELFKRETAAYNALLIRLDNAKDEEGLNAALLFSFQELGIKLPWKGDFNTFMQDKSSVLVFE